MFSGRQIAVVIPAYNEERFIRKTLEHIPQFVDQIVVVDDSSMDRTPERIRSVADARITVVRHTTNRGVGGAIVSGYREALRLGVDITVVMAGDGQMDPADLPALIQPVVEGRADYVKGNRFRHPDVWRKMPKARFFGNLALSLLTRVASGYPHIVDSQCGYTAISNRALALVDLDGVYPRYGFPNDMLAHLHSHGCTVEQVVVRPVYEGQGSGIYPVLAVGPLSYVLARSWVLRMIRERNRGQNVSDRVADLPSGCRRESPK